MDVVPKLAEPGEMQGVVGDKSRAVIDHEDESAGQQQKSYKPEKAADHTSPYTSRARAQSAINGAAREIQPHQYLISLFAAGFPVPKEPLGVDAAWPALYKTGNGGGRNPAAAVL
jgi:hypothetical protein